MALATWATWGRNYVDESGRKRYSGTKELKGTQAYPDGFGRAVQSLLVRKRSQLLAEAQAIADSVALAARSDLNLFAEVHDAWEDAAMHDLFALIAPRV